jgi:cytochrome c-type biogenesis protein CcmH
MADDRRASRPAQAEAEAAAPAPAPVAPDAEFAALMDRLRQAVAEDPANVEGLRLLARNEFALGNLAAARDAQVRLIAARGDAATAADHADLAEMMIAAAGGYVSPEAEAELERALARDRTEPRARYYGGLMMAQAGRYDLAFRLWEPLFDDAPDAAFMPALRAQMPDVALRAGVDFAMPEVAPPGTPEEMVARLSARLAAEGGPAADWARLITSLGVLGRAADARAIWTEAQGVFAADAPGLKAVNDAAAAAGLVP